MEDYTELINNFEELVKQIVRFAVASRVAGLGLTQKDAQQYLV